MSGALYNTAILRLASSIPYAGRIEDAQVSIQRVSPVCGSRVMVDMDLDEKGRVSRFAQEVRACALGQAAASILGTRIIGMTAPELVTIRNQLAAFLKGRAGVPEGWPGLELFVPARAHKGRHASIMLAFQAAADAAEAAMSRKGKIRA